MLSYAEAVRRAEAGDTEAQEALAVALEQAGRPSEAASWLQQAADAGRASAVARLGLWRLVGFGLPAAPTRGVADIFQAARENDPLGLALASVVTAGGVGVRRDVPAALSWLARTAVLGDSHAAGQLALLVRPADPGLCDAILRDPRPIDYDRVLAAIDLSAFEAPIVREEVRATPSIAVLPNLIPTWACDYVMALAGPVLTRGKVVDRAGGESVSGERTNSVMNFGLVDSDVILELINWRAAEAAGLPAENAEGLGVLHYAPGEQYAPHVDYIPDTPANAAQLAQRGQRVRTLLIYLNDDFEGGATEFLRLDLACKPPRGSGLVFDNVTASGGVEPLTLHRGSPPTRGQKWLISKWFRTKPLRPGPGAG